MSHPISSPTRHSQSTQGQKDPVLAAVSTSFPNNIVDAEQTYQALVDLFPNEEGNFIRSLIQNSGVKQRHTALPPEDLLQLSNFTERNLVYDRIACKHALIACQRALEACNLQAQDVDAVIDVSCTGIRIPALDVFLSKHLALRPDVVKIPIGEAGCAAGSLALGLAQNLGRNGTVVLVCAVEMCTLSFIRGDIDRANLIASVLFGDGAAAAVVLPPENQLQDPTHEANRQSSYPRILASGTHLFPNTEHAMGFDIGSHGLRLVLDRSLPILLRKHLRQVVQNFLGQHQVKLEDIGLHLVHTGGQRILDIYEDVMGLERGTLGPSRKALALRGNISSVSILMVMEQAKLDGISAGKGKKTLAVAFGPGLSVEMFLMEGF